MNSLQLLACLMANAVVKILGNLFNVQSDLLGVCHIR